MKKGTIFIIGNNPELSANLQKAFFAMGYKWSTNGQDIANTERSILHFNNEAKDITYASHYGCVGDKEECEIINLSGYRRFISIEERHPVDGDENQESAIIHVLKNGETYGFGHECLTEGGKYETLAFLPLNNPPDPELLKIGLPKKQAKMDVQLTANGKDVSVDEMMELLKQMKGDK